MSASNLPILYRNVLDGTPSDLAREAFLWATERPENDRLCYFAETFAHEVDRLVAAVRPMLEAGFARQDAGYDPSLMQFILTRHANWRTEGNAKISYGAAA